MTDPRKSTAPVQAQYVAPPPAARKKRRGFRVWISYFLFFISAALFIAVLAMYLRDRNDNDSQPVPTVEAGQNRLIDVRDALKAQGLNAEFGRGANRTSGISQAAQLIDIDGETVYVFIYPDPSSRKKDQKALKNNDLLILNTLGTPIAEDPPYIYGGSNVIVATYSDDEDLRAKIQAAVEGLP